MPGTVPSGSTWSGYAVGNLRFSGWPAGIGVDQLSISFQSGLVARRRGLDQQPGVPGLAVGAGRDPPLLRPRRRREELARASRRPCRAGPRTGRGGCRRSRSRGCAAPRRRPPAAARRCPLEGQQVDVEDLAHARTLATTALRALGPDRQRQPAGTPPGRTRRAGRRCARTRPRRPGAQRPAAALPSRPAKPLPVYVRSSTQPPWRPPSGSPRRRPRSARRSRRRASGRRSRRRRRSTHARVGAEQGQRLAGQRRARRARRR